MACDGEHDDLDLALLATTGPNAIFVNDGTGTFAEHRDLGLDSVGRGGTTLTAADVDGLICGYSTTFPHLMLSTTFVEHYGLAPTYAHGVQMGGGTGFAMVMLALAASLLLT